MHISHPTSPNLRKGLFQTNRKHWRTWYYIYKCKYIYIYMVPSLTKLYVHSKLKEGRSVEMLERRENLIRRCDEGSGFTKECQKENVCVCVCVRARVCACPPLRKFSGGFKFFSLHIFDSSPELLQWQQQHSNITGNWGGGGAKKKLSKCYFTVVLFDPSFDRDSLLNLLPQSVPIAHGKFPFYSRFNFMAI